MAVDLAATVTNSNFLTFTDEELEIQSAAAAVLSSVVCLDRLHKPNRADLSPDLRREFGSLGWYGLALPESAGGSGLSAVEHALFFRECGRECAPLDILTQSLALRAAVGREQLSGQLAAGAEGVMLLVSDREGWRLLGDLQSRLALCVERDGASLLDLTGIEISKRPSLDPGTSIGVLLEMPTNLVVRADGAEIWHLAQLGAAAMLVGVAERALALILEYAKVRETFGRKIGCYQAVRHPCADMELRAEAARSQLWYSAAAHKEGRADASAHTDAAKHIANEAALANADVNIQLHGGIGVTDEHHAHLLLKRALLLGRIFGSRRTLLPRILFAALED